MTDKLNLTTAAALLAELKNKPHQKDDILGIIRAGAAGQIPVYWYNDLGIRTGISNFTYDLPHTDSCGPVRLTRGSLRELATSESISVMDFQFTDQDHNLMEKMQGRYIDKDGNLLVFRHPATTDGTVTVRRDQLFVFERELRALVKTTAPSTSLPPVLASSKAGNAKHAESGQQQGEWWETEYNLLDMAQNIGERLNGDNSKHQVKIRYPTSVRKISEEMARNIANSERRKGSIKPLPAADTIRGRLTRWKFKPG